MQLRQGNLTWQVVGEDVVVLDLEGSVYLKVNGSGRVLWEALTQPCTESALVARLVDRYGINEAHASTDVETFLADLRSRDLLAE